MKSLPNPARDLVRDHLKTALEVYVRKGQQHGYAVSNQELDALIALYDAYDLNQGAPHNDLLAAALTTELRAAIHDSYSFTQQRGKLGSIRTTLMLGVHYCPICGITTPKELDHYLPKSVFMALAIYVRNLVPLCHDCNQSKGAATEENPAKRFPHPYFDSFPDVQFLQANVQLDQGGIVVIYSINPASGLPAEMISRLDHQLTRLRLNERYKPEINTYLIGHGTALRMCFAATAENGVRGFLREQAGLERGHFHRNHWRPVLLDALADHEEFCAGGFLGVLPLPPQVAL